MFITLVLLSNQTQALNQGHIKLLAVTENEQGNISGSPADLYLEILPGSGRVFLDTMPFAKLDTQMSTRFANKVACDFLDIDCSNYDFVYTIKANSVIIGGPSAGAAISVLTVAVLDNLKVDESIAISGTINSGGIIGPVGGLKEKIDAAANSNIKKVIVPFGEAIIDNEQNPYIEKNTTDNTNATNYSDLGNNSINLTQYGFDKGVIVEEAASIDEAIFKITGKDYGIGEDNIVENQAYSKIMAFISKNICDRSNLLIKDVPKEKTINESIYDDAINLSKRAQESISSNDSYSAASYCFGANIKFRYLSNNDSKEQVLSKTKNLNETINNKLKEFEQKEISTINDLQTMIIVKNRIDEAIGYVENVVKEEADYQEFIKKIESGNISKDNITESFRLLNISLESLGINDSDNNTNQKDDIIDALLEKANKSVVDSMRYNLAYGIERMQSALSWSRFFNSGGKSFEMDKPSLKKACLTSISETQERYQYVKIFYPEQINSINEDIEKAQENLKEGKYDLCLFSSAQGKSRADILLSVIGVSESKIDVLIDKKLAMVRRTIAKEQKKGIFPILGFSYYEYATSLRNHDKMSSLLYAGYALEMSNLDLYFNENKKPSNMISQRDGILVVFLLGLIIGICITYVFFSFKYKGNEKRAIDWIESKKQNKK